MRHCAIQLAILLAVPLSAADETARREYFETKIRPVLVQQCLSCHTGERPQAGLRLDYRAGWENGGKSGPSVVRGDPGKSLLLRVLRHEQGVAAMPLGGQKLSPETIAAFEEWIRTGAFDPRDKPGAVAVSSKSWKELFEERRQWWSLQPVSRPPLPTVKQTQWSRQPIDRFTLAAMESAGLRPVPRADRSTLIRRLSFVLTGLPPTPEEVDAFVADRDPEAYARVVSRLLDSAHLGEHWARHWMDVVRYSDTYGYESDIPAKGAWRYRDYLIRAFNEDVPFDQFVREQIAGDLLPNPRINPASQINESLIGPMFYQMGEKREGDSLQFNGIHQEMVNNKIDAFSKAFQAMTVGCARCHDHKLDAISQRDYYAVAGMFMSSRWVANTLDTPERNRATLKKLTALKPEVRETVAQWWLKSVSEIPKRLEALTLEKDQPKKDESKKDELQPDKPKQPKKPPMEDPSYIWFELKAAQEKSVSVEDTWLELAARYAEARKQRLESNARDYTTVADFSNGAPTGQLTE